MHIFNVYKHVGETPLAALRRFATAHSQLTDDALTYAGRLDPLAEGVLLVLANATQEEKERILALPKTYTLEILCGISTDTYDLLGMPRIRTNFSQPTRDRIEAITRNFPGKHHLRYPPYSSRPVDGKPLFQWAREGRIDAIHIPTREIQIAEAHVLGHNTASAKDILERVHARAGVVTGDFRQDQIIHAWNAALHDQVQTFPIYTLQISCSSGTYMRSLAQMIGAELGIGACAYGITRTRVGVYTDAEAWRG